MVTLEYYDGKNWVFVTEFKSFSVAMMSLGPDNFNHRIVDKEGKELFLFPRLSINYDY